jgi:DNA-binding LacI/PurR family transcriptional regulator
MSGKARRVGIVDVAAAAGVSVATVSRSLRGFPNVAESTRERVLEATRLLDYRPNPAAVRLAAGITNTIAVATLDPGHWFVAEVIGGIDEVLTSAGYDLLLSGITDQTHKTRFLEINAPNGDRCDAVILVDVALTDDEANRALELGYTLASVGFRIDNFSSVTIDNTGVARLAVDHLIGLGHRRIGLVNMPGHELDFKTPQLRRRGYLEALENAGMTVDPGIELTSGFSPTEVREPARRLLERVDRPTAVFATSDRQAFGVMLAAGELGVRIPEDLSLVGVDDHEQSELVGLTTVRQNVAEQGRIVAELLLEELRGETVRHVDASTELIVRSSTAPMN